MSKQIYSDEETSRLRAILSPRMKSARLRLGMTQVEAAKLMGISAEFYARMERGNAMPSVTTLFKMAGAFECSVDYLFGADQTGRSSHSPFPPRTRAKDSRNVLYIADRASKDPDLNRLLILLLKVCDKYEGRNVDDDDDDE